MQCSHETLYPISTRLAVVVSQADEGTSRGTRSLYFVRLRGLRVIAGRSRVGTTTEIDGPASTLARPVKFEPLGDVLDGPGVS